MNADAVQWLDKVATNQQWPLPPCLHLTASNAAYGQLSQRGHKVARRPRYPQFAIFSGRRRMQAAQCAGSTDTLLAAVSAGVAVGGALTGAGVYIVIKEGTTTEVKALETKMDGTNTKLDALQISMDGQFKALGTEIKTAQSSLEGKTNSQFAIMQANVGNVQVATELEFRALRATIQGQFQGMENRIQGVEDKFEARFQGMEDKFEARFQGMEDKFEPRFQGMEDKFEACLRGIDGKFEARFHGMGDKFEALKSTTETELAAVRADVKEMKSLLQEMQGDMKRPIKS